MLFGVLLQDLSPSIFIHSLLIYLYQQRFKYVYFILWIIIWHYVIYFFAKILPHLAIRDSFVPLTHPYPSIFVHFHNFLHVNISNLRPHRYSIFSSRNVIILYFAFKSRIDFEIIFLCGVRYVLWFMFLISFIYIFKELAFSFPHSLYYFPVFNFIVFSSNFYYFNPSAALRFNMHFSPLLS